MTTVLGVDPGLAATGYGVIEVDGSRMRHRAHGVIRTTAGGTNGSRLQAIYDALKLVVAEFRPQSAGVESLFFAKNATSAIPVAQARGVVLLLLEQWGIPTGEYPPQAIKQAIVGQGRAEKHQVKELVALLLALPSIDAPDHATDALAAAICHYNHRGAAAAVWGGADVQ